MVLPLPNYFDLLKWDVEKGMGYLPVDQINLPNPYNSEYWDKYCFYASTDRGRALTAARIALVNKHTLGSVVDVGIGCGDFVETRNDLCLETVGIDVNPIAIEWLKEKGFHAKIAHTFAATFWDSLEHIKDPVPLLNTFTDWIFVTIPIFRDYQHVAKSKHFRPNEHYWYFTHAGFVAWMWNNGFKLVEFNKMEELQGREDVTTFVFKRR